jgi:hypothetical protein
MAGNNTSHDDMDMVADVDELIKQRPLIKLFGTNAKAKLLSVLVDAYPRPLNVTTICDRASIHHDTWYQHRDDLLEVGIVVDASDSGTSLYSVPDPETDVRTELVEKLIDYTAHYRNTGNRCGRDEV